MNSELEALFNELIRVSASLEEAKDALRKILRDNPHLQEEYLEWCDAMEYHEKKGFEEYYYKVLDEQTSLWGGDFSDDYN